MPVYTGRPGNLQATGPVVPVGITIPVAAEAALSRDAQPIPSMVVTNALIDTGAAVTAVDPGVARELGLLPVGYTVITTASAAGVRTPLYAIRLLLGTEMALELTAIAAVVGTGFRALVGRDVLAHALFVYNGPIGEFIISL
jgi:predicted aspartyl protease